MYPLLSFAMFVPDYAVTPPGWQAPRHPQSDRENQPGNAGSPARPRPDINLGTIERTALFFTKPPWWRGVRPGILRPDT
jgi:hypothetical protein